MTPRRRRLHRASPIVCGAPQKHSILRQLVLSYEGVSHHDDTEHAPAAGTTENKNTHPGSSGTESKLWSCTRLEQRRLRYLPGEVAALIGDNGAGKSTMVKALTGNLELDSGDLFFEGKPVTITSTEQASRWAWKSCIRT